MTDIRTAPKPDVWGDRITKVLEDPEASRLAAVLYYLVVGHLSTSCFHKRTCPERSLLDEAERHVQRSDDIKKANESL